MMRVVLDVNVLVSGFVAKDGPPADILAAWSDMAFELVVSEHILAKAVHAWNRSYFLTRYTRAQVQETIVLLRSESTMVVPTDTVHGVAPNDEDDDVLATAVAGRVDYLVTGDKPFRNRVKSYQGIVLLSPRDFLALLEREDTEDKLALE